MNNTSQLLLDELKKNHPDLVCFIARKDKEQTASWFRHLSVDKQVDLQALSDYAHEAIRLFQRYPGDMNRYLAHLDPRYVELGIVYENIHFLFVSKKEHANEMLLQDICLAFCEKIHPSLQQSSSHSLHAFTHTFTPEKKPTPKDKPAPLASTSAEIRLLREQPAVRVEYESKAAGTFVHHLIAQKSLGKYAQTDLLQARQSLLQPINSQLVLSQFDFTGGQIKATRPFVQGRSMAELIQSRKKMQLPQALAILQKLVDLLTPLHKNGFAHGNIHPHNVFFSPDREILLTDDYLFDLIASPRFIQKSYSQESRIPVGYLGYLAPEQLLGETARPQSDFWALGYLFCYLLLGEPVLAFKTPSEQIVAAHYTIKEAVKERILSYYPSTKMLLEGLIEGKLENRLEDPSLISDHILHAMQQKT